MLQFISENMVSLVCVGLFFCFGIFICGYALGINDRKKERDNEMSSLRTNLAISEEKLRRSRQHISEWTEQLSIAQSRIRLLQESNQRLVLHAVMPPEIHKNERTA